MLFRIYIGGHVSYRRDCIESVMCFDDTVDVLVISFLPICSLFFHNYYFLFCLFYFWATPGYALGLLLALWMLRGHSWWVWGTIWGYWGLSPGWLRLKLAACKVGRVQGWPCAQGLLLVLLLLSLMFLILSYCYCYLNPAVL